MIKAFQSLIENANNKEILIEQRRIHEDLALLIHLHCPSDIRCTQCINLHESYNTQLFLCDVYETMANIIWLDENAQDSLLLNQQALEHISSVVITYSSSSSEKSMELNLRNSSSSQQSLIQHRQSNPIIVGALYLLCFLLTPNSIHCTNAGSIHGLIEALVVLAKLRKNDYEQISNWKSESDIRYWSNRNLNVMLQYGNIELLKRILQEQNIIRMQIDILGSSEVRFDQDSMVVIGALINIEQLYANLRYGNEVHQDLPVLVKFTDETVEEEGGLEEIESNSFHLLSGEFNNVQFHARVAVGVIINSKISLQEQIQG
ncbi:MAG: hypothetical protein EZS28_020451 [Streblomastix strix]|uniref:Uncharacterized protein n=1 Tax=Streblomastix strix TaxID=222440 RepID=A0A5J4VN24_9EUKA|nr:MAG: hypothetical protein EZS28_020451 [Streblomastix strix]